MAVDPQFDVNDFVRRALAEDIGSGGDITSAATIGADVRFTAEMDCRQPIVVAGMDVAIAFFQALDRDVRIEKLVKDGDEVEKGSDLLRLEGNARAMLSAERLGAEHAAASVGHRHADAAICRQNCGHRRDRARHAQDHSRASAA